MKSQGEPCDRKGQARFEAEGSGVIQTFTLQEDDECRIKTKSKDIRVRYFLFAYEQLIESIWYLFYHEEVSFKKYLMELSEACTVMVNNVERKERTRKQP